MPTKMFNPRITKKDSERIKADLRKKMNECEEGSEQYKKAKLEYDLYCMSHNSKYGVL